MHKNDRCSQNAFSPTLFKITFLSMFASGAVCMSNSCNNFKTIMAAMVLRRQPRFQDLSSYRPLEMKN